MKPYIEWGWFCSDEVRIHDTHQPFVVAGYQYATDGRICIRVPSEAPDTAAEKRVPRKAATLFENFPACTHPWPAEAWVDVESGASCYCVVSGKCPRCGYAFNGVGSGCRFCCFTSRQHAQFVGGLAIQTRYDAMIRTLQPTGFDLLPQPEGFGGGAGEANVAFRFPGGGEGIVRPLNLTIVCPLKPAAGDQEKSP